MANAEGLRRKVQDYGREVMAQSAPEIERALRTAAPMASGELVEKIRVELTGGSPVRPAIRAVSDAPQSNWTEEGTQPHVITPRGEGYPLRFYWPKVGADVAFMRVNHPGNPARPWFRPTLAEWGDVLQRVARSVRV